MSEEIDKHVTRKYDVAQKLGKGAYGIVWKATDKKSKRPAAPAGASGARARRATQLAARHAPCPRPAVPRRSGRFAPAERGAELIVGHGRSSAQARRPSH